MKWLRTGSFAALDQAWLSFVNFGVSIAFIRYGTKSDYGLYMLLFGAINLVQGFQNALFISPFATLYPQAVREERNSILCFLVWGQILFGCAAACLGLIFCWLYFSFFTELPISSVFELAFCFAMAILGLIAREASRSYQYVLSRAGTALVGDMVFGFFLIAGLVVMIARTGVNTAGVLVITGLAGLLPLSRPLILRIVPSIKLRLTDANSFWSCGRWAIIGVVISWMNMNLLGYAAAAAFGLSSVAEITAARLFMMPLVLGLPVWSNLLRPRFSQWYSERKFKQMCTVTYLSSVIGTVLVILYLGLIAIAYPWLENVIGKDYFGIFPMIVAWAIFYIVVTIRTVLMANLMVNESGYKSLSKVSSVGLLLLGPAMLLASQEGAVWMIYALIAIEIAQTFLVWWWAREYWRGANFG